MPAPTISLPLFGLPRLRRWTKQEYHTMGELGWFEDQQVELLDGEIVEMPVPKNSHCVSTDNTAEILRDKPRFQSPLCFLEGYVIGTE
jgi:hypothetical protein